MNVDMSERWSTILEYRVFCIDEPAGYCPLSSVELLDVL